MKSGFISILGKPNVGKSTLLNQLVGSKVAAVSKKPQTTRQVIRGILTEPRGQIIFLDTPGFHKPKDQLGKFMVRAAANTFHEADLFYWMVEPFSSGDSGATFLEELRAEKERQGSSKPVFCIINKVDCISKPELLPVIDHCQKIFPFDEIFPISALTGDQVDLLLEETFKHLPEHEPYFPPDIASDQTERFLASEMIREKIFRFTGEEIPYASAVQIDEFKEEEPIIRIEATVFTEKESQKGILIGAKGQKMKEIGQAARIEVEDFFDKKVFLKLWVKTLKNWKKDEESLKRLGFQ